MLPHEFRNITDEAVVRVTNDAATYQAYVLKNAILTQTPQPYPYYDLESKTPTMAVIVTGTVHKMLPRVHNEAPQHMATHTVYLAVRRIHGLADYSIWCGDRFMEGIQPYAEAETRCQTIVETMGTDPEHQANLLKELMDSYGAVMPKSDGCNFWHKFKKGEVCKHVSKVLYDIGMSDHLQVSAMWDTMLETYDHITKGMTNGITPAQASALVGWTTTVDDNTPSWCF